MCIHGEEYMSKKFLAAVVIVVAIAGVIVYRAMTPSTIDNAIEYIDSGNYKKALRVLSTLAKTANYEDGERIYYYRLKALLGFINELNEDYN